MSVNYDKLFDDTISYNLSARDIEPLKAYLNKKQGWVYIARSKNNHLLKIGRTGKNPLERAKTLGTAGVLHDYEIFFALRCFNQFLMESRVHHRLRKFRIRKEFFNVNDETAIDAIQKEIEKEERLLERFLNMELIKNDMAMLDMALKQ